MKKLLWLILVFVCVNSFASDTEKFQLEIRKIAADFASSYSAEHPDLVSQQGITVLDISNETDDAKKAKIGHLVQVSIEEALQQSLVFYPVDRKNMETILDEMKLSLSGLINSDSAVEAGELSGVACLVSGSVSESGSNFLISLNLTEVSTGIVIDSRTLMVEKARLKLVSEELQYSYVAANGIGLSAAPVIYLYTHNDMFNKGLIGMIDTMVKYRINKNSMLTAGVWTALDSNAEWFSFSEEYDDDWMQYSQSSLQTGLSGVDSGSFDTLDVIDIRARFLTFSMFHIDYQYTFNFTPWFNIGISLGGVASFSPRMEVTYHDLYYKDWDWDELDPNGDPDNIVNDSQPLVYLYEMMVGGKLEINPEFFITPRLAINGKIGYMLDIPSKLFGVDAQGGRWLFLKGNDHSVQDIKYFDFDPSTMPGTNEDPWVLDLSGLYISIGMSVFF